jgi:hypothetical protein
MTRKPNVIVRSWIRLKVGPVDPMKEEYSVLNNLYSTQEYLSWRMEWVISAAAVHNNFHDTQLCFHLCEGMMNCGRRLKDFENAR